MESKDEETALDSALYEDRLPRWRKSSQQRSRFIDALWVGLNASATIAIVFMNKFVFADPQLRKAQIMISMWHFAATFIVLCAASRGSRRLFTPIRLPTLQVLPLSAFFAGFLLLNNLSLATNPVGVYQLAKILTAPAVVWINFILFRKTIERNKILAVLITCTGVGIVSVDALRTNVIGTAIAGAAVTITACYQIWIGKKIVDLGVEAPQLLLNQSATAVCLLIPISLCIDTFPDFSIIPANTLRFLFAGGIVASFINLSQFMIIGRTSALTFNIVSNIKMLSILSLGWYSEGKIFTLVDVVGILLAFSGAWWYTKS
ncbi:unnamed protein product [Zymoseptoria tritici ST99CH_3D1]|uniref:Sugar phosphate transporter domain-containing protein n=1 Tax=Zymoseptoria tritici (strain ST99CH_3D7) TaxID=1276538 RepID=A0A1X7RPU5_ZYMT9|nr:unnamed protein product [Zymoseptoria tritici ST99CH_3D7]SMR50431.1 unnamed protein product [Zymoseptoria tritici ST99CH_3D1]